MDTNGELECIIAAISLPILKFQKEANSVGSSSSLYT